jgi:predicted CxxxxCH...CXXCH cytochrome family protein
MVMAMVWGCTNANDSAVTVNAAGQHPVNWVQQHGAAYLSNPNQCKQCHGSDLLGGISKVSCSSNSFGGQSCHSHPVDWSNPGKHGAAAKAQPGIFSGFASCRAQFCHGADFSGGGSGVSCFSVSTVNGTCHLRNGVPVGAPHSPVPWLTNPSPTHTNTVDDAAGLNAAACALCHTAGKNLRTPILSSYASGKPSCFNSTLCHGVEGHPPGWAQPKNHGLNAMANLTYCQQCHADQPLGGPGSNPRFNVPLGRLTSTATGTANNGCEVCHAPLAAHPRVLQIPAVFGTITTFNALGTPWYQHCQVDPSGFDACSRCHGANLDGVGAAAGATSCRFCHLNRVPTTLMDCASCHGNPPDSLPGPVYPNIAAAHPSHVSGTAAVAFACGDCHAGLGSVTLDHFTRAKNHTSSVQTGAVVFGAMASTGGLAPAYNESTQQCTNTYCHGNTLDKPATAVLSPTWSSPLLTGVASHDCALCHGYPPATTTGHPSVTSPTQCAGCHPHVNAAGTGFVDPTKHINGAVDASGGGAAPHAIPVTNTFPGSVHMSVAGTSPFASCTGCHTNTSANKGVYPAAVLGNPPDCQGCHTKSGPIGSPTTGCYSCHGNVNGGGRPTGSTFPDVAGQHSNNHGGFGCSTCHGTAGTGQSSHGPSNRVVHNDSNVTTIIEVTNSTGVVFTRSGLGDGHGTCTGTCNGQGHSARTW